MSDHLTLEHLHDITGRMLRAGAPRDAAIALLPLGHRSHGRLASPSVTPGFAGAVRRSDGRLQILTVDEIAEAAQECARPDGEYLNDPGILHVAVLEAAP